MYAPTSETVSLPSSLSISPLISLSFSDTGPFITLCLTAAAPSAASAAVLLLLLLPVSRCVVVVLPLSAAPAPAIFPLLGVEQQLGHVAHHVPGGRSPQGGPASGRRRTSISLIATLAAAGRSRRPAANGDGQRPVRVALLLDLRVAAAAVRLSPLGEQVRPPAAAVVPPLGHSRRVAAAPAAGRHPMRVRRRRVLGARCEGPPHLRQHAHAGGRGEGASAG